MRTKGIGPQGLGIKGNNGYKIGSEDSPAKQVSKKEYKKMTDKFSEYNQKNDTILSARTQHIENAWPTLDAKAKLASNQLYNRKNKTEGNSKNIVKNVESEDDKHYRQSNGDVVTYSLYKKDALRNAVSPAKKKDACYSKVKSRYKKWPSAYASGALVKCRKVGAANWGNKSK